MIAFNTALFDGGVKGPQKQLEYLIALACKVPSQYK